jgi:integrase
MPIFERDSNARKPYQIRIRNPNYPASGKKFIWGGTYARKRDAERRERELLHDLDHGTFIEPSQTTLGEYLPQWLEGSMDANERTRGDYQRLLKRYVLSDPIAVTPLAKLTTLALETLYKKLGQRLSPRSVRMVHGVLRSALKKAERDRLLLRNPTTGVQGLPKQARREMHALNRRQLDRLLAISEATSNRHHALWCVLAEGGLRPSEALRLPWDDVGTNWVVVRGETKTASSRRTVTLPASTMTALAWHRTQQEAEKIAAGGSYRDMGRVFASQTGGPLDLKNVTARHFKPLLNAYYPLPNIRVYDFRHTHASILLAAGTPVHVVSKRLGHASAKMTLDVYAHVLSGQDDDAVTSLEAYMAAGRS